MGLTSLVKAKNIVLGSNVSFVYCQFYFIYKNEKLQQAEMDQIYKNQFAEKVVITAPCEYEFFYKIGTAIENMGARYTRRIVDHNNLYWSFIFSGHNFILHYTVDAAVYVYPAEQSYSKEEGEKATYIAKTITELLEVVYEP